MVRKNEKGNRYVKILNCRVTPAAFFVSCIRRKNVLYSFSNYIMNKLITENGHRQNSRIGRKSWSVFEPFRINSDGTLLIGEKTLISGVLIFLL